MSKTNEGKQIEYPRQAPVATFKRAKRTKKEIDEKQDRLI
jgi:hypothetical protein